MGYIFQVKWGGEVVDCRICQEPLTEQESKKGTIYVDCDKALKLAEHKGQVKRRTGWAVPRKPA